MAATTAIYLQAAALALRDVPEANSRWSREQGSPDAARASAVDISVAVATPSGLITPILTGADRRGLADIGAAVRELAGRARAGKLKPEEYQGGSFSISNLGEYGVPSSTCLHTLEENLLPNVLTTFGWPYSPDTFLANLDHANAAFVAMLINYLCIISDLPHSRKVSDVLYSSKFLPFLHVGMFGISSFSAVINPPQACILAVGSGVRKVLPPHAHAHASTGSGSGSGSEEGSARRKGALRVATTVTVQLSGDRRVVDEALAAQFLQAFRGYLSNPAAMML